MFNPKQGIGAALSLTGLLGLGSCSVPFCEAEPSDPKCSAAYYVPYQKDLQVVCSSAVLDNRADNSLEIKVSIKDAMGQTVMLPPGSTGAPKVYLTTDQNEVLLDAESVQTQPDRLGLNVIIKQDTLGIGQLKVRVALSDAMTLQITKDSSCTITRSPRFAAASPVMQTPSPRGLPVTGFTGVQIGTVLGSARRLLLVEQVLSVSGNRRWAELYGESGGSVARDGSNSSWVTTVQPQLQESDAALFAVTRDALLIYDVYAGGPAKNLSLFALNPASSTRTSNLTAVEPIIRTDRIAMAAASDDQLLLLGSTGQVSWFRVTPGLPKVVNWLNDATVMGNPVLAARAERSAAPKISYGPYFGVAWGADGNATLLRANVPTADLTPMPLPDKAQQSFAAGLNGEQVVAAALADLNGDGLEDLLTATSGSRFLWAPQQLDSQFGAARELNVKPAGVVTSLAVGDLNGDGLADLAAVAGQMAYVYLGTAQ